MDFLYNRKCIELMYLISHLWEDDLLYNTVVLYFDDVLQPLRNGTLFKEPRLLANMENIAYLSLLAISKHQILSINIGIYDRFLYRTGTILIKTNDINISSHRCIISQTLSNNLVLPIFSFILLRTLVSDKHTSLVLGSLYICHESNLFWLVWFK